MGTPAGSSEGHTMARVLITGAAGGVGRFLRAGLPAFGWELRGFDLVAGEGEAADDWVVGDLRDSGALDRALDGADAVVHLAAISGEAPFEEILAANIDGTYRLFEAARRSSVKRVVYASSNHAVGFTPRTALLGVDTRPRPDTYY